MLNSAQQPLWPRCKNTLKLFVALTMLSLKSKHNMSHACFNDVMKFYERVKPTIFSGMKSHDCHIFMECLLPIALSALLEPIWKSLTEVSQFFRDLCSTMLCEDHLLQMEQNIPIILCDLERIFSPTFFDSIEHLLVHLPYEARMGGPVQYHWMYPFER
uniref:DUF4218 domain-containing protein n=1 Tax=Cajanus cajan TaxID=3821 RepID=A0A151QWP7_CAJCA|nr:hypothetical protein KK1_044257 [Cajanus cajan]